MDVAGDQPGDRPRPGAKLRRWGQEWRGGKHLVEVLEDGERLGQHPVAVHEHGDETLGIECPIGRLILFPPCQVDEARLIRDPLEVQGDADPVGGRAAKIGVEDYERRTSTRCSMAPKIVRPSGSGISIRIDSPWSR